jgi:peptide/nickel transport system permease protein
MMAYIARRVLGMFPLLLVAAFVVFLFLHIAPGDPISLLMPEDARPEDIAKARERLGLDEPLYVQFGAYLLGLVQFDFGQSLRYAQPVADLILERIPATLELALAAAVVGLVIGITLGCGGGRQAGDLDRSSSE